MDNEQSFAMLQRGNDCVFVNNLPFVFGRKHEKSPPDFMDICIDGIDKTVSREYAVINYSDEKVCHIPVSQSIESLYPSGQGKARGLCKQWFFSSLVTCRAVCNARRDVLHLQR